MLSDVSLVKARWGRRHSGLVGREGRLRDSGGRRSDGPYPSPHGGRRDGPARRRTLPDVGAKFDFRNLPIIGNSLSQKFL